MDARVRGHDISRRFCIGGKMCIIAKLLHMPASPASMRTNIEIDDKLMAQAIKLTGLPTKRAVVEEGLRLLVRVRKQAQALKALRGLGWEGDLDEMRQDRPLRSS